MKFEILDEIAEAETFAAGSGIREVAACGDAMGAAAGASEKVSRAFA